MSHVFFAIDGFKVINPVVGFYTVFVIDFLTGKVEIWIKGFVAGEMCCNGFSFSFPFFKNVVSEPQIAYRVFLGNNSPLS